VRINRPDAEPIGGAGLFAASCSLERFQSGESREGVISLIEAVKKTIPVPSIIKAG
jgi:hypothetical protein